MRNISMNLFVRKLLKDTFNAKNVEFEFKITPIDSWKFFHYFDVNRKTAKIYLNEDRYGY